MQDVNVYSHCKGLRNKFDSRSVVRVKIERIARNKAEKRVIVMRATLREKTRWILACHLGGGGRDSEDDNLEVEKRNEKVDRKSGEGQMTVE